MQLADNCLQQRLPFTSFQKHFQGNQKDVGIVEANKANKQSKDFKVSKLGSYHCPVCHKQVYRAPPSHMTIPIEKLSSAIHDQSTVHGSSLEGEEFPVDS